MADKDRKDRTSTDEEKILKEDPLNDESFEEAGEPVKEDEASEKDEILKRLQEEALFNEKKIKNLEDDFKKVNNEAETFKERLQRLNSEYENYRNRSEKEKSEMADQGKCEAIKNILPVIDNLERALSAETDDLEGLKNGVMMTLDQFSKALEKMGVSEIETENGFDPELHEAVMHDTDPEKEKNVVSEVFLKGYKVGNKVIRHTVVKVTN